jgi:thioredoxin-dependent peroxiredoxin
MPDVGEMAPDFTAETDSGENITLSALRGKKVILYFYPKDNTSGCTKEACDFRDNLASFTSKEAVILGVSPDSVKSHQNFKAKYELPFTLVADPDKEIVAKYGVFVEKKNYGRTYMGVVRTTFLIDESGKIEKVYNKVKVAGHVEAVLADA